MRAWITFAFALMLAAGCVGGEEPSTEVATAKAGEEGATTGADVDAQRASASGPSASGAASATEAPEVVRVPLAFEGVITRFVQGCAFTPAAAQCESVAPDASTDRFDVVAQGNVSRAVVTLTWSAASPLTDKLGIFLYSFTEGDFIEHGFTTGTSPLVLEVTEPFALPDGWTHRVAVGVLGYGAGAGPGSGFVATNPVDQPFTIEGELVTHS